jgi:hypothetical protein
MDLESILGSNFCNLFLRGDGKKFAGLWKEGK